MKRNFVLILAMVMLVAINSTASADIVAHWSFDNSGDLGHDDSELGHNGTVNGAVVTTGEWGNALSFNGSGDYVDVADAMDLNPTDAITITAWFKADSFACGTSWPPLVKKSDDTQTNGYGMEFAQISDEYTAKVGGAIYLEGPGWVATSPLAPVSVNTWYFVAIVYDGETISNYVCPEGQGQLEDFFTSSINCSGNIVPSFTNLNIGRDPSNTGRYFDGIIDEVRIFDRAIDSDEIKNLYLYNQTTPEPATLLLLGLGGLALRRKY